MESSSEFDAVGAASLMPDHPNVWTDGSLVWIKSLVSLLLVLGSSLICLVIAGMVVGGVMLIRFVLIVPFRLQSVQGAEMCCVIFPSAVNDPSATK